MRTLRRSPRTAAAVGAVVLALLASCRSEAPAATPAAAASPETTLRNVTDAPVRYTIRALFSTVGPIERTLAPGRVDRFPGAVSMDLEFHNGDHVKLYRLEPGSVHSFRLDEQNRLELFLGAHGRADALDLAPFVPTPMPVVERMLALAEVKTADVVYDIGCGDGRILITAARLYGARGVGIDVVPERIRESRAGAREAGVEGLVEFRELDATTVDFSPASVVTLYLLPESNALLRPKLEKELKPGTRVVTHNYTIPGWEAKGVKSETLKDARGTAHGVYLYVR